MNIEELKRLAEAASKAHGGLPWQVTMARHGGVTHYHVRGHCEPAIAVVKDEIARHIAAANPAAVLELIRQRDELLAALEEIRTLGHNYTQVSHRVWKIADAAIAKEQAD